MVTFMFSKRGQHVNHELVRVRIIYRDELGPAFHEPGDESDVTGQPVKLSDDQHRAFAATQGERGRQLRPVILPPAFNLRELG